MADRKGVIKNMSSNNSMGFVREQLKAAKSAIFCFPQSATNGKSTFQDHEMFGDITSPLLPLECSSQAVDLGQISYGNS